MTGFVQRKTSHLDQRVLCVGTASVTIQQGLSPKPTAVDFALSGGCIAHYEIKKVTSEQDLHAFL